MDLFEKRPLLCNAVSVGFLFLAVELVSQNTNLFTSSTQQLDQQRQLFRQTLAQDVNGELGLSPSPVEMLHSAALNGACCGAVSYIWCSFLDKLATLLPRWRDGGGDEEQRKWFIALFKVVVEASANMALALIFSHFVELVFGYDVLASLLGEGDLSAAAKTTAILDQDQFNIKASTTTWQSRLFSIYDQAAAPYNLMYLLIFRFIPLKLQALAIWGKNQVGWHLQS